MQISIKMNSYNDKEIAQHIRKNWRGVIPISIGGQERLFAVSEFHTSNVGYEFLDVSASLYEVHEVKKSEEEVAAENAIKKAEEALKAAKESLEVIKKANCKQGGEH